MLKHYAVALTALLTFSTMAHADDFGPRFANEAHAAFSDPTFSNQPIASVNEFMGDMNDIAAQLQGIMPAAGDETPNNNSTTPTHIDNTSGPNQHDE